MIHMHRDWKRVTGKGGENTNPGHPAAEGRPGTQTGTCHVADSGATGFDGECHCPSPRGEPETVTS